MVAHRRRALPARRSCSAGASRLEHGVRADLRRPRGHALFGSRLCSDLRSLRGGRRPEMRGWLALGAAVAVALLVPAAASAHATIAAASPETQSRISSPPTEIRLQFNEAVTITPNAIQVFAPDGKVLSGTAKLSPDGHVVTARVSRLRRGSAFTVRWRVTGQDGHSPAGVYTFGI
ncbi:MAG: copper resistance protein CopC, partial [Actinobacteria bacterium]